MEIVNWVKSLLLDYGAMNVIIMFLTIFITNIIKKPIVNHADDFVASAKKLTGLNINKQVITSNIIYIPIGVAFVLYFIYTLIMTKFSFSQIVWSQLVSNSLVYGMLSMTVYDIGKAKIQAYIDKAEYKTAKAQIKEIKSKDLLVEEQPENN